jgi:hypothetical protein
VTAIETLQRAIARTEERLQELSKAMPDTCPCCLGAAYGGTNGPYMKLEEKLDRQEAWLEVLLAKPHKNTDPARWERAVKHYTALTYDRTESL